MTGWTFSFLAPLLSHSMITRYGYDNAFTLLAIGLIVFLAALAIPITWLSLTGIGLGMGVMVITLVFFRDPIRQVPAIVTEDPSLLVAPADGKVVVLQDVEENLYINGAATQISIFLSPLDVHVNRSPAAGTVRFYEYKAGDYLVAWHPKSSELNEQSRIGLETPCGPILFKQITGVLARRIVCELSAGDVVEAGQKIGMMKFGSRMDIIVPRGSEINVKLNQRVVAGETIIAKLRTEK